MVWCVQICRNHLNCEHRRGDEQDSVVSVVISSSVRRVAIFPAPAETEPHNLTDDFMFLNG